MSCKKNIYLVAGLIFLMILKLYIFQIKVLIRNMKITGEIRWKDPEVLIYVNCKDIVLEEYKKSLVFKNE